MLRISRTLFENSKTLLNLAAAFAGESQARNKYTFYGQVARKEGYHYIADIFDATANNELVHAKEHFKLLGELSNTEENLSHAALGEKYEWEEMYPLFEKEAIEEGDKIAANLFAQLGKIEKQHMERYEKLLKMVQEGTVYERESNVLWECGKCGWSLDSKKPPPVCPACKHPKEYFFPDDF